MKLEFAWPRKGDHPFIEGNFESQSPTWVDLKWLEGYLNDSVMADAFRESGDKIIKDLERKENPRHSDVLFMPIAYLYRHSLELQMKQVIRLGIRVGAIALQHVRGRFIINLVLGHVLSDEPSRLT